MHYDAIIAGAGPAGLVTGIALADRGFEVCIVEPRRLPIDKACGEGWMPTGLAELTRLGLWCHMSRQEGHPIQGVRYVASTGSTAEARFREGAGLGLRRTALSRALAARAASCPSLSFRPGAVGGFERAQQGVRAFTERETLSASLLIGADGLHSRIRRRAGLSGGPARFRRWGIRRHFGLTPWTDHVEVHFGAGVEAYVTPTGAAEVDVALLWDPERAEGRGGGPLWTELLHRFPMLVRRLADAPALSAPRAIGPLQQTARGIVAEGVALVGDAAGYVDAITGEGLSLAVAQAQVLARHAAGPLEAARWSPQVLDARALSSYARAVTQMRRGHVRLSHTLLALAQHPALIDRFIRALATSPAALQHLMSLNMGSLGWQSLGRDPRQLAGWLACANAALRAGLDIPRARRGMPFASH